MQQYSNGLHDNAVQRILISKNTKGSAKRQTPPFLAQPSSPTTLGRLRSTDLSLIRVLGPVHQRRNVGVIHRWKFHGLGYSNEFWLPSRLCSSGLAAEVFAAWRIKR
jgi:hypothetical protein